MDRKMLRFVEKRGIPTDGEPSGAAVAAARRAGSPRSEQMDRKMLRFVEKRGIPTDGEPSGAAVAAARRAGSPRSEQMDRKMLRFVEKRGIPTDKTFPARTEVLSARGEESKPVAHPCRGPGGQAGDHQKRQGHPWPLFSRLTPHASRPTLRVPRRDQRGQVVRRPSPAGNCLTPTAELPRMTSPPKLNARSY